MAEFIMRELLSRRGITGVTVASSATSTEEIWNGVGSPIYPPAAAQLEKNKIPYTRRRAVLLTSADYGSYDIFVGMDSANLRNMRRIFGGDPDGKIRGLMEFTDRGGEVSDPWYTRCFDKAYADIYDGCVGLVDELEKKDLRSKI